MPCDRVDLPGGVSAIICSRGRRQPAPCFHCRQPSDLLCDFPTNPKGKTEAERTCSRPICRACSTRIGGADFCKPHAVDWKARCA